MTPIPPLSTAVADLDLLPCPFCGGTNIDPAEWSGNDGQHGPGCGDCGALADSAELWNRRAAPASDIAAAPEQQDHVAPPVAAPAGQQDSDERAFNTLYGAIMNIPATKGPATRDFDHWYKIGHRDARHAAADLVAEAASGFREGRNAQDHSVAAPGSATAGAAATKQTKIYECKFCEATSDRPGKACSGPDGRGHVFNHIPLATAPAEVSPPDGAMPETPHWYDGEQSALGGKTAREGYAANPMYAAQPAKSVDGAMPEQLPDEALRYVMDCMGMNNPDGARRVRSMYRLVRDALAHPAEGSAQVAPWTDFAGNPIHAGDTIAHPSGERGKVLYEAGRLNETERWRVSYYGKAPTSSLALQIGDKGQAVVEVAAPERSDTPAGYTGTVELVDCGTCGCQVSVPVDYRAAPHDLEKLRNAIQNGYIGYTGEHLELGIADAIAKEIIVTPTAASKALDAAPADERRIPDSECKQGSCMRMETGCRGRCSLARFDVPIVVGGDKQGAQGDSDKQAAQDSGQGEKS